MRDTVLIADTRERAVIPYFGEDVIVEQLTTADYLVASLAEPRVIYAAIERKSLDDYAASIVDSRTDNFAKMIELREKTHCAILLLIEGLAPADVSVTYNGVPYRCIESHIFHAVVRDGFTVLHSMNVEDTAQLLMRFCASIGTIDAVLPCERVDGVDGVDGAGGCAAGVDGAANAHSQVALAMRTRDHTREEIALKMLMTIDGIGKVRASKLLATCCPADLLRGKDVVVCIAALACIPRVTKARASALLASVGDTDTILGASAAELATYKDVRGKRYMGAKVAETAQACLHFVRS